MSTYQKLLAQMAKLQEQVEAARLAERETILAQVCEFVATYALTEREVFGQRLGASVKRTVAPKYRNPNTGMTWSGRGRPPAWIDGKNRDRFLIQN